MNEIWQLVFVLMLLFLCVEALAIMALARAIGVLQVRLGPEQPALLTADGLAVLARAPAIRGRELRLHRDVNIEPKTGRWALVFVSATCSTCRDLARELSMSANRATVDATVVLIARGSHEQNAVFVQLAGDLSVISDANGSAHRAFSIELTPFAFIVDGGVITAKGVVNTRRQVELLLQGVSTRLVDSDERDQGHGVAADIRRTEGLQIGTREVV